MMKIDVKLQCCKCKRHFDKAANKHSKKQTRRVVDRKMKFPALVYFKVWYQCPHCGKKQRPQVEGPY